MFPILVYFFAIYLISAAVFGLELYAIERNEPPTDTELWVTAKEGVADAVTEPTKVESPRSEDSDIVKPDVTRRKRKKLIRRLHKLSSQ